MATTAPKPPIDLYLERAKRRLTRRKAAELIGVSQDTLRRAELRLAEPSLEHAILIAEFYGFDVKDVWPSNAGAAA